ncbi:glycine zipper 2TM domain-containing protein [Bordetella sp. 02P26C-1]|uniref:glycine zipper 2TM domain-containing protein n=1 Tax=Bordetella sp. 02P26C-1 TaxID=2683195 RepID=UPI0013554A1B|nr:glycine zipper 2TM domain-containing protein [Bordetella sp. 02P26C-1]MVW80876.1 glycine zipper 2TM domain-containing protein [Bordetella sp. 02P26C-1]
MKIHSRIAQVLLSTTLALGVGSVAVADDKTQNTIIGAGVGGVAGALLSDGDPLYTVGGAAAGGLLGNVLTDDDDHKKRRHWDNGRRHKHGYQYADHRGKPKHGKHKHKHHKHRH